MENTSPTKTKRVSFGPTTIIPIPRRGKYSLSLSTLDESEEENDRNLSSAEGVVPSPWAVAGDTDIVPAVVGHRGNGAPQPSLAAPLDCLSDSLPTQDSATPALPTPQTALEEDEHGAEPRALSDSQLAYLTLPTGDEEGREAVVGGAHDGRASQNFASTPEVHAATTPPADWCEGSAQSPSPQARDGFTPTFGSTLDSGTSPRQSSTQRFAQALSSFLGTTPPRRDEALLAGEPADDSSRDSSSNGGAAIADDASAPSAARGTQKTTRSGAPTTVDGGLSREEEEEGQPRVTRRLEITDVEATKPPTAVCVFCGRDGDGKEAPQLGTATHTPDGQVSTTSPLLNGHCSGSDKKARPKGPAAGLVEQDGVVFHAACALWAPEVYCDAANGTLLHLRDAVARSERIKCALCRKPGASVGCGCADCQLSFHWPCAAAEEWRLRIDRQNFTLWCPLHKNT